MASDPTGLTGEKARRLASELIHSFFTTQLNPMVKHHLTSYDQFLQQDIQAVIKANNPLLLMKNPKALRGVSTNQYKYKVEVFIGGEDANELFLGTPTVALDNGNDVRVLLPNEARLRNLTYAAELTANILVRLTIMLDPEEGSREPRIVVKTLSFPNQTICRIPLMLQSKHCLLNGKPGPMLAEMGECAYDQGGYFIIDGSEKVLVTRQEAAFNTLWISHQNEQKDPNVEWYATMSSLNPETREVKRVSFYWLRERITQSQGFKKQVQYQQQVMEVSIPYVLKPIPLFVLFRALGLQTDKEILQLIFPDPNHPDAKLLADMLIPSINASTPFLDTYSAVQYIVSLTKGFSTAHVLDIVHNHLFPHVTDYTARPAFLADCVRKILRAVRGIEVPPSRDDTRHQRLQTSGFLCLMLFQNLYKQFAKKVILNVDQKYSYNESVYTDENFEKIFSEANPRELFEATFLTEGLMRGFKGKWMTGPSSEESGILQELSRMSYIDFMSHLRHAVLNFDTSMKLAGPRRLNPSQYGYFCTSETPSGKNIGIVKNITMLTMVSTAMVPQPLIQWLTTKGRVIPCAVMTPSLAAKMVPVYVNSGLVGYTARPQRLSRVLRLMKRTGCLPPLSSSGFSIPERKLFIYTDGGRPLRPLIICEPFGTAPKLEDFKGSSWVNLITGSLIKPQVALESATFTDPLGDNPGATLEEYEERLLPHQGKIEYIDPYEHNELLIANQPEHIVDKETTHMEVHPSAIMGLIASSIPFANHNQSPRNQLGSSQSKQGLSMYATNWKNRFDNTANVLAYGEAPLTRTIYQDYVGGGLLPYGQNVILALGMYGGYNQEDGIIMNADAMARGQFRSINYRSYEAFEENDPKSRTQTRIGHPKNIPGWTNLKSNLDYNKLDESGIIKQGEYVDQNTVIVARYMTGDKGSMTDASVTPQVWTRGRVESVVVTISPAGLKLVKIRVVQDRTPELGDKFSNRHGQKGTLNVLYRGHDMPRTADGIVPDMIMNPTAIPSRMTIGQILEQIFGLVGANIGALANGTTFMNEGSPHEELGKILESIGLNKMGNHILYNGMTGEQMESEVYMGIVYGMRLKHMTEDKWNARGEGRKEQRTHQPTGGRGNEGGLKIGEMERDAIIAHGASSFLQESMMKRSDGTDFIICDGCGTIPLYNEKQNFYLCPMCDGPIQYTGELSGSVRNLEPIPPPVRSVAKFSKVEMPYATKLFFQELATYANLSTRILTTRDTNRLKGLDRVEELTEIDTATAAQPLPVRTYQDLGVPELKPALPAPTASEVAEQLARLNAEAVEAYGPIAPLPGSAAAVAAVAQAAPVENMPPLVPVPAAPTAALVPSAAPVPTVEPALQLASIAPQPLVPVDANLPVAFQPPQPVAEQEGGGPIIQVDTSEAALAAEGLRQPNDRNLPVVDESAELLAVKRATRARSNLRRTAPQPQQQFTQQPQEEEQQTSYSASAPVQVVKLG